MTDLLDELKSKLKDLAGGWASYSALGSFVLYVLGYLAVRFHLTTFGLGTDLAVLDERYLFTGAKFLIYLTSTFPIILLIAIAVSLLLAVPGILIYLLYQFLAKRFAPVASFGSGLTQFFKWFAEPRRLAVLGIIISVVIIQFVMRQCYFFSNLLLASALPPTALGLEALLFDETGGLQSLFFAGLLAAVSLNGVILFFVYKHMGTDSLSRCLVFLLAVLVVVQILLLPVNYGVFVMDKEIPKISSFADGTALKPEEEAWLVWEGTHGMTYLVQTSVSGQTGSPPSRSLVTLPQKDFKKLEIQRYDQILRRIFAR